MTEPQQHAWALVPNPAWAGRKPGDGVYVPDCHDGSHFVTLQCSCSGYLHVHESQIAGAGQAGIAARCPGCSETLVFEPGVLQEAFARLRAEGWIA